MEESSLDLFTTPRVALLGLIPEELTQLEIEFLQGYTKEEFILTTYSNAVLDLTAYKWWVIGQRKSDITVYVGPFAKLKELWGLADILRDSLHKSISVTGFLRRKEVGCFVQIFSILPILRMKSLTQPAQLDLGTHFTS